jgi:hypothetical protein
MRWRGPGTWSRFLLFPNVLFYKMYNGMCCLHGHAFSCVPHRFDNKASKRLSNPTPFKKKNEKMLNLDGRQLLLE